MTRRRNKVQPRRDASTWDLVETLIHRDWSPEQISGRLRAERGIAISHEWIYLYIYQNKREGVDLSLPICKKTLTTEYVVLLQSLSARNGYTEHTEKNKSFRVFCG